MSLSVTHQVLVDDHYVVVGPEAWRVALEVDEQWRHALPMAFACERDADRARQALEQAGLTSQTALLRAGRDAVTRIMVESLA
jgi:hypothetical protein